MPVRKRREDQCHYCDGTWETHAQAVSPALVWQAVCANCGARGPEAPTREKAKNKFAAMGWIFEQMLHHRRNRKCTSDMRFLVNKALEALEWFKRPWLGDHKED